MPPLKRITCHKCRHYYVTWESAHPHGCRALGFKSKHLPSAVVRSSSGAACLYFEAKTLKPARKRQ
ncbi:MAG: uracil-DNA glycosylase [Desulfatitalea sp.]|nr:uracil-DNA glycosylase [Desulfatitalea sp.]